MMYPYSYETMPGALNKTLIRCLCTFYRSATHNNQEEGITHISINDGRQMGYKHT